MKKSSKNIIEPCKSIPSNTAVMLIVEVGET